MTALAEMLKSAGVDTNAALLRIIAADHLRKNGLNPPQAVKGFTEEIRDAGGILVALLGDYLSYSVVRDAAFAYLAGVERDMKGLKASPQGDGGVRDIRESRIATGAPELREDGSAGRFASAHTPHGSSSPQNRSDAVLLPSESRRIDGRVAPIPNRPRVDLSAMQAATKLSGPSIFDTLMVRGDRAVGDIRFGEIHTIIATNRREAALLDMIRNHAQPFSPSAKVRDVIKMDDLQRMVQKAAEISDAA